MDDLLARLHDAGFAVELTGHGPRLMRLTKDGRRVPDELLAEVKQNRARIMAHLGGRDTCSVCGWEVDEEDKEVIATNHVLCDRAGSKGCTDGNGGVVHEESPRCPFKTTT